MNKRLLDNTSKEQEYEERRQFIRQNAPSMDLKTLVKEFCAKFSLQNKSAAFDALLSSLTSTGFSEQLVELKTDEFKRWMSTILSEEKAASKLSLAGVIKRHRTKLEISGVIKGSRLIQGGMDTLVPDATSGSGSPSSDHSPYRQDGGSVSPSVAYQQRKDDRAGGGRASDKSYAEDPGLPTTPIANKSDAKELPNTTLRLDHFATLGQAIDWDVDGTDMVQRFHDFRAENQGPFSLARDGIADLTQDSPFCQALEPNIRSLVRRAEPAPDIHKRWPTLGPICDRVFASNNYDDVADAVRSESMQDPIASYLFVIIMAYWQFFQFHDTIPENINEREGFTGLTWSFIQTPLTLYGLQSRCLEVLITAVEDRKNQDKDHFQDVKEIGQYADAVAIHNNQQLLLAEASLIHYPKLEKRRQDEYKLSRAMRDSWVGHIRSISSLAVPPRGLAMFGSVSFKDETKLLRMDFQGAFRLQQFDLFIIPLNKRDFGSKMRSAVISCLELAARLQQETERRCQPSATLGYNERVELADALRMIEKTTSTPTKVLKTPKKK
ncbi:hypothetical protein EC991_010418 [Linnemannia zychae]|nr:hypothetical protein EC991_010418 [Linnemannia zychae]